MARSIQLSLMTLALVSAFQISVSQSPGTNIALGSSLSAGNDSSWLSPSRDFAFGFYNVTGGLYLVGIWYNRIPAKTFVWSANRDSPVQRNSVLLLTNDGRLLVQDPQTNANFSIYNNDNAPSVSSASMEDNGNFVLRNNSTGVVWQSFDSPTDTLLPGQMLNANQRLISNVNGTHNHSTGRYVLTMQDDSNLVLSTNQFANDGYWWATNEDELGRGKSLVFDDSTALMYIAVNQTSSERNINVTNGSRPTPVGDYYHRAMIDDGGNFRQYAHAKVNGSWLRWWSAVKSPCHPTAICGPYGYCTDGNEEATCQCLRGFSWLDPNDQSKGCRMDLPLPQTCGGKSLSTRSVEVYTMTDTDFPHNGMIDLSHIPNSNEDSCRRAVEEDCFCAAAVFDSGTCKMKRAPLLNGRGGSSSGARTAFIKVAAIGTTSPGDRGRRNDGKEGLVAGLVASSAVAALLAAIVLCVYVVGWLRPAKPFSCNINLQVYSYKELKEATDGFARRLGRGSFGTVYSGVLRFEDRRIEVAVKQLQKVMDEGEKEFRTEISVIGRTHHKNLVRLLGFCDEKDHRLLVYELMKGGSLSAFLFTEYEKPSWGRRAEIALGIAGGLSYLHEECETQIIHCDIKPQNVLLDENNTAKIADFGLAKLLKKDQTRTSTNVRGTMGYMAPEWLKNVPVTAKVDVYSFGIMLLEIICCRRHIELDRVGEESETADLFITDWVESCIRGVELGRLVEQDEEVLNDLKRFERMAMVGLWCADPDPALRPSMKRAKQMLEGTVEVGLPPSLAG